MARHSQSEMNMPSFKISCRRLLAGSLLALLAACGQKGSLYMPSPPTASVQTSTVTLGAEEAGTGMAVPGDTELDPTEEAPGKRLQQ